MKHSSRRFAVYSSAALCSGIVVATASVAVWSSDTVANLHGAAAGGVQGGVNPDPLLGGSVQTSPVATPDLALTRTVPDVVAWDAPLDVRYVVTNNGGRVTQANIAEPLVSGSFDAARKIFILPIVLDSTILSDQPAGNRVRCGPFAGNLRCIFSQGIGAGESIAFSVRYIVPPRNIQCDRYVTLGAATVSKGMTGSYPPRIVDLVKGDANSADNTAPAATVRIDCTSITGDLSVGVQGPATVARNGTAEYSVTIANVGSVRSLVPPVRITIPSSGYDLVSVGGPERGTICLRDRFDASNQRTCVNPSIFLEPHASLSYRLVLRARAEACLAGTVNVVIASDMSMPTPRLTQIYETNVANNIAQAAVTCDPSLPLVESTSSSSSLSSSAASSISSASSKSSADNNGWKQWWLR